MPNSLSLSQALLAPLNSLFKAQLHAARSFISMVNELAYERNEKPGAERQPWTMDFQTTAGKLEIPVLALMPVSTLGIQSAEYRLALRVESVTSDHSQSTVGNQKTDAKRPWYLVHDPVSVRGSLAPPTGASRDASETTIQVDVKVAQLATPIAFERLVNTLADSVVPSKKKKN